VKILRRFLGALATEVHALAWTLAGAGTVLITLSGDTRTQGIWITLAALVIHFIGAMWNTFRKKDDEE
jgi:hypothetical protein